MCCWRFGFSQYDQRNLAGGVVEMAVAENKLMCGLPILFSSLRSQVPLFNQGSPLTWLITRHDKIMDHINSNIRTDSRSLLALRAHFWWWLNRNTFSVDVGQRPGGFQCSESSTCKVPWQDPSWKRKSLREAHCFSIWDSERYRCYCILHLQHERRHSH